MNKHIIFDIITASVGGFIAGKKKFFVNSILSLSFKEHVAAVEINQEISHPEASIVLLK